LTGRPVRALIVLAHPLAGSLCGHLAGRVEAMARAQGWEVAVCDLSADGFDPRLTVGERSSYYKDFQSEALRELEDLVVAEVLILVFPTWWFGFPAVLKGWFDRVWAPGAAFDHAPGFGPMIPRLHGLREVLAVTTMGAPGWVDWLVMRRPLARVLRWGIVRPCAPKARVTWRALYRAEGVQPSRLARFERQVAAEIAAMARRL
jgi:NAD(P)H dehydrogenase (quinone)